MPIYLTGVVAEYKRGRQKGPSGTVRKTKVEFEYTKINYKRRNRRKDKCVGETSVESEIGRIGAGIMNSGNNKNTTTSWNPLCFLESPAVFLLNISHFVTSLISRLISLTFPSINIFLSLVASSSTNFPSSFTSFNPLYALYHPPVLFFILLNMYQFP